MLFEPIRSLDEEVVPHTGSTPEERLAAMARLCREAWLTADLEHALGTPLVLLAKDLRSSGAFAAGLQRFIRALGVQTIAELLATTLST